MMASMLDLQRNWRDEWIIRTIQNVEELERRGEEAITIHVREFQHLLTQLLAAHQHADRLETLLCSYPVMQQIKSPLVFGGEPDGCVYGSTVSGLVSGTVAPLTEHVFNRTKNNYRVCVRCNLSDTYVMHNNIVTCKGV